MSQAIVGATGQYRYWLCRQWDRELPHVCFCMLNPSTADAASDDPTIRRCIGFAKSWGFGSLSVVNLFAYKATCPRELKLAPDPIGLYNFHFIKLFSAKAAVTVAAWGIYGGQLQQDQLVMSMLNNPQCLGTTAAGHPKHPLYVPADTVLETYENADRHSGLGCTSSAQHCAYRTVHASRNQSLESAGTPQVPVWS